MHSYEDASASLEAVRKALRLGIVHWSDATELVDDLCHVSVLQQAKVQELRAGGEAHEQVERLSLAVDLLIAKWRKKELVSQTEIFHLLRMGLREAELGRAKEWRNLLRAAVLPPDVKE